MPTSMRCSPGNHVLTTYPDGTQRSCGSSVLCQTVWEMPYLTWLLRVLYPELCAGQTLRAAYHSWGPDGSVALAPACKSVGGGFESFCVNKSRLCPWARHFNIHASSVDRDINDVPVGRTDSVSVISDVKPSYIYIYFCFLCAQSWTFYDWLYQEKCHGYMYRCDTDTDTCTQGFHSECFLSQQSINNHFQLSTLFYTVFQEIEEDTILYKYLYEIVSERSSALFNFDRHLFSSIRPMYTWHWQYNSLYILVDIEIKKRCPNRIIIIVFMIVCL